MCLPTSLARTASLHKASVLARTWLAQVRLQTAIKRHIETDMLTHLCWHRARYGKQGRHHTAAAAPEGLCRCGTGTTQERHSPHACPCPHAARCAGVCRALPCAMQQSGIQRLILPTRLWRTFWYATQALLLLYLIDVQEDDGCSPEGAAA